MLNRASTSVPTFSLAQKQFCWGGIGIGIRGASAADPDMPAHRHSFFQILFVARGTAFHEIGEHQFHATAGSIFFVSPFVVHRVEFPPETECFVLYFDAQFVRQGAGVPELTARDSGLFKLPELAPFVYQAHCSYQLNETEIAYARERCAAIERACAARGLFDAAEARAELTLLLTCVGRKYLARFRELEQAHCGERQLDARARKAIAFLKAHFRADIALGDVAREVSVTGNYLTLLLKRETGKSFKQLLDEIRLENSKNLLAYTDAPIKRIAVESGFMSQAHFARRFKTFTSLTPLIFRRRHHARAG